MHEMLTFFASTRVDINTAVSSIIIPISNIPLLNRGKHPKAIIGNHTMPYKRENPVKSCYVKELLDIIDSL